MINFSKRMFLASLYDKWIRDGETEFTIEYSPVTMITFLQINGMLNEDRVDEYISHYKNVKEE